MFGARVLGPRFSIDQVSLPLFGFLRVRRASLIARTTMAVAANTSASLPTYSYKISHPERTIRYIQTSGEALLESQASYTALQGSFLGLDIEWKPNWRKGAPEHRVALIQLASRHEVLLFHIYRVGEPVESHYLCEGIVLDAC